ncbi:MAG: 1-deoxy-D-xylulose-5-phosphate synthase [Kiritimatiellia bacterium]
MTPDEIRSRILSAVSRTGGHLASSLGAVELAVALAETFDPGKDRIVWDVGHQAYAWKILTGRADRLDTLRQLGGLSGFPNPAESPADAAVAGHAGVALSVAEGLAAARDQRLGDEQVVAVIGDSSFVNGTCFEALNNCMSSCRKVIVILNDNEMSISRPTGAFSRYLGRLIAGRRYNRFRGALKRVSRALHVYSPAHGLKVFFKRMLVGCSYFEEMGLRYMGPVDGHDLAALKAALAVAREDDRSVVLHIVTQKGRGFAPAERNPTAWHGVGPFDLNAARAGADLPVPLVPPSAAPAWSDVFGDALAELAAVDARIVALTAGMKDGTGLAGFAERFPARFQDVGIAEGHMVAYAAGLAAGGARPVVAVYSTFLQRAVDQVMHDVCIARLPVVFCVDRAGVVGADGVTHQGLYDLALLRCLPNLTICQPKDADDLRALLKEALDRNGPTVIRYPKGKAPATGSPAPGPRPSAPATAIWATGDWYAKAQAVAARVPGAVAVHARYLKPFDAELLAAERAEGMRIVSLENGCVAGGLGEAIGADVKFGWPDVFIPHGAPAELERRYGLDVESIVARLDGAASRACHHPSISTIQPPTPNG